jgi:Cft2 family RNA processing exonuclease
MPGGSRGRKQFGPDALDTLFWCAARTAIQSRERWTRPNWPVKMVLDHKLDQLITGLVESARLRDVLRGQFEPAGHALLEVDPETFAEMALASDDPRSFAAYGLIHPDKKIAAAAAALVRRPDVLPPAPEAPPRCATNPPASPPAHPARQAKKSRIPAESTVIDPLLPVKDAEEETPEPPPQADEPSQQTSQRRVLALEREVQRLRLLVPSKRERRRQRRRASELQRTREVGEAAETRIVELEDHIRSLNVDLATAREDRDDALNERDTDRLTRQTLELRLGDTSQRGEYLRNLLPREIEVNRAAAESSTGRARGRLNRHVEALEKLVTALDDAFPPGVSQDQRHGDPRGTQPVAIRTESLDLRVLPLGGATEIGGSAVLIEVAGKRILVDAGLRPRGATLADMSPPLIDEAIRDGIDLVVITHAHTDHAGYVPALLSRLPRTEVVCTSGTAALLHTMWDDSRKVLERRLEKEAGELGGAMPLYTSTDIELALSRIRPRAPQRTWMLAGLELMLFPAGHILGAAGFALRAGERRVLVTGDISDREQATAGPAHLPGDAWRNPDLLVIESTYCTEDHPSRQLEVDAFVKAVGEVVSRGGRVLIPAFGLGRAQEVILVLRERIPGIPIIVDGIARDISHIYEAEARRQGLDLELLGGNVRVVENRSRNMEIRAFEEGVVVTTSGMLKGGPAIAWAADILPDPAAALFLCGYQDEESPGARLLDLVDGQSPRILDLGESGERISVEVRARFETYHLSAHADQRGLMSIIDDLDPLATMLVHGYPGEQRQFRDKLRARGTNTVATGNWTAR